MGTDLRLMCGSRGGGGGGGGQGIRTPPPPEKSQKYRFLSNTGLDPLKITSQASIQCLGHHQHASGTPFKWCYAGGSMMARLKWYLFGLDPLSPLKNKSVAKVGPPLTKLPGSAHAD